MCLEATASWGCYTYSGIIREWVQRLSSASSEQQQLVLRTAQTLLQTAHVAVSSFWESTAWWPEVKLRLWPEHRKQAANQRNVSEDIWLHRDHNKSFANSCQNPLAEWQVTMKPQLVSGFIMASELMDFSCTAASLVGFKSESDHYFHPHVACPLVYLPHGSAPVFKLCTCPGYSADNPTNT